MNQDLLGVEVIWGEKSWPIQLATDLFGSYKEDSNEGLTAKTLDFSGIIVKDSDISTGAWAGGGVF